MELATANRSFLGQSRRAWPGTFFSPANVLATYDEGLTRHAVEVVWSCLVDQNRVCTFA